MIPTIEQIVEDLAAGAITKAQAVTWLYMHAEGSANELRDHFAASALTGAMASTPKQDDDATAMKLTAAIAYGIADAMLLERAK